MQAIDKIRQNISTLMLDKGTNETALAKKASLGHTAVRDILSGKSNNPTHGTLAKIATALEVDVAALTGQKIAMIPVLAAKDKGGMSESAAPYVFRPHPVAQGSNQNPLNSIFGTDLTNPATFRVNTHQISFGYLPGDILVADISRLPAVGDICIVSVFDDSNASSVTHLRRYLPPFLAAGDPADPNQLLRVDSPGVTVRHPIVGMIRGITTK